MIGFTPISESPARYPTLSYHTDPIVSYYRCPAEFVRWEAAKPLGGNSGFFRFGPSAIAYGPCSATSVSKRTASKLDDALLKATVANGTVRLPFDLTEVIDNLRLERYVTALNGTPKSLTATLLRDAYYFLRPFTPSFVRCSIQRMYYRGWKRIAFPHWPVDCSVDRTFQSLMALLLRDDPHKCIPFIWFWPDGLSCCAIMTHDVETEEGRGFCHNMMDIDDSCGIKSSFQIVPEQRYQVIPEFLARFRDRGFEINVHDLNHDGQLFRDRNTFLSRARKINHFAKEFGAAGFRSGAMYRQPEWLDALEVSYDMSIPNAAHMEPQRGGCCTVMPYFIDDIVELPLTTTQDWALYNVLRQDNIELWKQEIELISAQHGLISFIVHPDYTVSTQAQQAYGELLTHLAELRSKNKVWTPLPREVNEWWRQRAQMQIIDRAGKWVLEGAGKERARIAYARLLEGELVYDLQAPTGPPAECLTEAGVAIHSGG